MTGSLPPSANVAHAQEGAKLFAPAAERNSAALCRLLKDHAPAHGMALELASGTGQHVTAFARACPGLLWQPTEVAPERLASIDAYATEADLPNLRAAMLLDATVEGWHAQHSGQALVVLINLLHLISAPAAETVVREALCAVAPGGCFILYGPFMRDGVLTSDGDARFHAQLSEADPAIGYKDTQTVTAWLRATGAAGIQEVEMPANNLAFIAKR
jgi:hypothetical protein